VAYTTNVPLCALREQSRENVILLLFETLPNNLGLKCHIEVLIYLLPLGRPIVYMYASKRGKLVTFQVLTAMTPSIAAFWNMTPCSLVMSFPAFDSNLLPAVQDGMKIGDSRFGRNVGNYVPNCTASQEDIYR
jgi:hypothetical protein